MTRKEILTEAKDAYKTVMEWVGVSNNISCETCKYRPRCDEIGNDWNCLEWSGPQDEKGEAG